MLIPTYTAELGKTENLGPSISVIYGKGIFDDVADAEKSLPSREAMNEQLKGLSNESVEFLPPTPMEDLPFEAFKESTRNASR